MKFGSIVRRLSSVYNRYELNGDEGMPCSFCLPRHASIFFFFNYHFYCNQNYRNYMIGKKRQKKFNIEYRKRWKRWRIELGTCFPNHCTVQIKITFLSYLYKTSLNTCTPEANWLQSLIYCTHQSTKKKKSKRVFECRKTKPPTSVMPRIKNGLTEPRIGV